MLKLCYKNKQSRNTISAEIYMALDEAAKTLLYFTLYLYYMKPQSQHTPYSSYAVNKLNKQKNHQSVQHALTNRQTCRWKSVELLPD